MPTAAEMQKQKDRALQIIKTYERLSGDRGNWESHWQEIAQRIWPNQSHLFTSNGILTAQGEKRTDYLFDSTASLSLNKFGAILDSLLTPMNQIWHKLAPTDPYLLKDRETVLWFEDLNRLLFKQRYAPMSNFISQNQLVYKMLGAYGSGCNFIDDLRVAGNRKDGLRYRSCHLSEIFFQENHQGIVDSVIRRFRMTARQIMQVWAESAPAEVKNAMKEKPEQEFLILHCVQPNGEYDPKRKDDKGKAYSSHYVCIEGQAMLDESGYSVFPYAISRYEQVPGEVYGRSPAMDVLPSIKTLNEEKKTMLNQGHRAVAPVLLAHDDGVLDTFSLRPGAINYGGVNEDGKPLVHALPVGNLAVGRDMMEDERSDIKEAFLVPLFQMLEDNPQMTATEVVERVKDRGMLTAPTIGRQYSEYHGPLIEREISILVAQKKVAPPPRALVEAKGEYRVEYESPMSRSQRAEQVSGLLRNIETCISISTQTQNPEVLDHYNWDVAIPEINDIGGVPAKWLNGADQIAAIRAQRAQAIQQQTAIQAAPGAAALSKADTAAKQVAQGR